MNPSICLLQVPGSSILAGQDAVDLALGKLLDLPSTGMLFVGAWFQNPAFI
ncbi:MAG: hypothetical protein ABSA12_11405 [Verrucomicrobiia bacterium]|jgi:hypothetical protein